MQRNQLIDSLRGFSMIVIIFTHATAYFPSDKLVSTLWNWSNFAVPIFIFCSVYLFLKKSSDKPLAVVSFITKRFKRLLIPYYIFLVFFLLTLFFITPEMVTVKYVWQSILVIGGVDINWLVLLFLCLTIILPFFIWSQKKNPFLFWAFFLLSFGSSIFLLFEKIPVPYKWIMWLPWSLMLYVTWFYIQFEQKKKILFGFFVLSSVIFGLSFAYLNGVQHSAILIHNKYPPNILYISFGVAVLLGLVFAEKYLFRQKYILKTVNFFSKYSYPMYFLHYLLLIVFASFIGELGLSWLTLFLTVLFATAILQEAYVWVVKRDLFQFFK